MDTIGSATSKNNVRIRLTYKRWAHIIDSHDYMSGNMDLVFETLEDPDCIVRGWADELIALKNLSFEKKALAKNL